jgi:hypothetical protein
MPSRLPPRFTAARQTVDVVGDNVKDPPVCPTTIVAVGNLTASARPTPDLAAY